MNAHLVGSGPTYRVHLVASAAFLAGILLALGSRQFFSLLTSGPGSRGSLATVVDADADPVRLEDHEGVVESGQNDGRATSTTVLTEEIADGIEGTIGNTPLVRLRSLSAATGRRILAKAEFLNGAGGSPKDRVALAILEAAEHAGLLTPGRRDTVYEGTVASTGISLAALARARGHRAHVVMPDNQSAEKVALLTALGAQVERVPVAPFASSDHYVHLARRRAVDHEQDRPSSSSAPRGFFADQFENPANAAVHERTTGPEIWRQTAGRVDAFVAGAGTGGTLAGIARFFKLPSRGRGLDGDDCCQDPPTAPGVRIVLADPQGSGLYHWVRHGVMWDETEQEGRRRRRQVDSVVEGIGINRVVANLESAWDLVDDAVRVTDDQACHMARWLAERDGVLVGSSSAVNCVAAVVAAMQMAPGSTVVTVLCDSGARHLSKFWTRIADMSDRDPVCAGWAAPLLPPDNPDLFAAVGIPRGDGPASDGML